MFFHLYCSFILFCFVYIALKNLSIFLVNKIIFFWLFAFSSSWWCMCRFVFVGSHYNYCLLFLHSFCRNPNLAKCGGEAQHLERVGIWSPPRLPNVQSATARGKTPRIGVFLVSLERSWNVNIENGLALVIWMSAAQVMGKRRAGSQTGSLTLDH